MCSECMSDWFFAPQIDNLLHFHTFQGAFFGLKSFLFVKDKDQLCIVKETLWNQSEKVDHLAYKYWCVLQGFGIIKMIRNLAQSS